MIEFLLSATTALLFLGLILTYCHCRSERLLVARQNQGIEVLKLLRQLLAKFQQHRGRCSGYINGDASMESEIVTLQGNCNDLIKQISGASQWVNASSRWQGIEDHWGRLKKAYKQFDAASNMQQHHLLIQNLLYLCEDLGDEHDLTFLCGENSARVQYLWKELLEIIEFLGQARAVGTGVAAKGLCSSVNRIKLNFLIQKLEQNQQILDAFSVQERDIYQAIGELIQCIKQNLLGDDCRISSQEYFATATRHIESLYRYYDRAIGGVQPGR